jgi:hypothetical protein
MSIINDIILKKKNTGWYGIWRYLHLRQQSGLLPYISGWQRGVTVSELISAGFRKVVIVHRLSAVRLREIIQRVFSAAMAGTGASRAVLERYTC